MNIYSNNEMAEMLAQSSLGEQSVQQQAAAAGVPQSEIQLVNGSGLGVENRISPRAVCAMFVAIQGELLSHQLSVACFRGRGGSLGTLETRHIPAATVIKTGTLSDVSAWLGSCQHARFGLVYHHHQPRCRCGRFSGWARPAASTSSAAIASGTRTPPL